MKIGPQKAKVVSIAHTISSGKGTYGIRIDCLFPGDEPLSGTIWFSEKAMRFARVQLRGIGFDPDRDLKEIVDIIDSEIPVVVGVENYNGEDRFKIERFGSDQAPDDVIAKAQAALRAAGKKKQDDGDDFPLPEEPPFH